jgi:hypothetical protein
MTALSRRTFHQQALGSLLTWSLLDMLYTRDAFGEPIKPVTASWLAEINEWSRDLKGKKLEQVEWQKRVESLYATVELPEMLKLIDFEKVKTFVKPKERGEQAIRPTLPQVEGLPTELVFGHQVFALTKGRSVVPHGHDNGEFPRQALRPPGGRRRAHDHHADHRPPLRRRRVFDHFGLQGQRPLVQGGQRRGVHL